MRPNVKVFWTGSTPFLLIAGLAVYLNYSGVRPYLSNYPTERLSQGLSGVAFTAPLLAGFCAWNVGRMRYLFLMPNRRSQLSAVCSLLLPTVAALIALHLIVAVWSAGLRLNPSSLALCLIVVLSLLASAALGSSAGLTMHPALGAPTAILFLFAWYALPIATDVTWLRTSNTSSILAACCAPQKEPSGAAVLLSGVVSLAVIVGAAVSVILRSRVARVVMLCFAIALAGALARFIGQQGNTYDGLQDRTTELPCFIDDGLRLCVWPENSRYADGKLGELADARDRLKFLALQFPEDWTESPYVGTSAVATVAEGANPDARRFSIAISLSHYWRCTRDPTADFVLGLTLKLGASAKAFSAYQSDRLERRTQELVALSDEDLVSLLRSQSKQCTNR